MEEKEKSILEETIVPAVVLPNGELVEIEKAKASSPEVLKAYAEKLNAFNENSQEKLALMNSELKLAGQKNPIEYQGMQIELDVRYLYAYYILTDKAFIVEPYTIGLAVGNKHITDIDTIKELTYKSLVAEVDNVYGEGTFRRFLATDELPWDN